MFCAVLTLLIIAESKTITEATIQRIQLEAYEPVNLTKTPLPVQLAFDFSAIYNSDISLELSKPDPDKLNNNQKKVSYRKMRNAFHSKFCNFHITEQLSHFFKKLSNKKKSVKLISAIAPAICASKHLYFEPKINRCVFKRQYVSVDDKSGDSTVESDEFLVDPNNQLSSVVSKWTMLNN